VPARRLSSLALTAAVLLATGMSLVFFYAPVDVDQGFIQKIALLLVTLCRLELLAKDAAARTRRLHRARELPSARPAQVARRHARAEIPQVLH
jgi:hypothetical protein